MAQLTIKESVETEKNLHVSDEKVIIEFLNANYKELKTISNLGSFIDNIKISNEYGIKAKLKSIIVERDKYKGISSGQKHKANPNGTQNIFEFNFNLPEDFPSEPTEKKDYVMLSTIKTYECETKQECSSCDGSGVCSNCKGSGSTKCRNCDGRKKVEKTEYLDNGKTKTRYIDCSECRGVGKTQCRSCDGSTRCDNCNGRGDVTCSTCDGLGVYQRYIGYSDIYKTANATFNFSEHEHLTKVFHRTSNEIAFNETLVEFKNHKNISISNYEKAVELNKYVENIIDKTNDLLEIKPNQCIGRLNIEFETVPITIINYSFEGEDYQISIVGEDNVTCYETIPKRHNYKGNLSKQFLNFLFKKKRQVSFLYIASYMFNSDGEVDSSELELFELFVKNMKLKDVDKNILIDGIKQPLTIEELSPKIKSVRKDNRALIFAWQCVIRDGEIKQSEIDAFSKLSKLFSVTEEELENIKHKATQFEKLEGIQMLEEYFKS